LFVFALACVVSLVRQYLILFVGNAATVAKYGLYLLDARWDGRWANKSLFLFAIEFSADLLHLALYIAFFMVITAYVLCTIGVQDSLSLSDNAPLPDQYCSFISQIAVSPLDSTLV
jgi:hypothetical protein